MLLLGVLSLVAGVVIGQREIVGLGALLTAVPLAAAVTVAGTAARITQSRAVLPPRVPAGHNARVLLRLGNTSPMWAVASVFLEDTLPVPLGGAPRFTLGRLARGAVRDVTYLVRPAVRGGYPLGPLRVEVVDPLGCVRVTRYVGAPSLLLVTPATVPLAPVGATDGSQSGDAPRSAVSSAGEQDPVPREYQHGDDLRRVHWRSTAKHGRLMVRRDEQHRRESSAVLLDTRASAHLGAGPHGSLETAVGIAASVSVHLADLGHGLRLHTELGRVRTPSSGSTLDALAVAEPSGMPGLLDSIDTLGSHHGEPPGTVVAVLGAVSAEEAAALADLSRGTRVAVLCTRAAWPSADALHGTARVLESGGWHVLPVGDLSELPDLWRGVASTAKTPTALGKGPR
ncbi:DUF58 domain-containing protein [Nocardiopsis sp. LOL_012]|uniref:DUF58 domain-containing protein n=1 Tax=Nocardiopsis sp. LOL_012 TaxID=3345409 RepID=UPI003A84D001